MNGPIHENPVETSPRPSVNIRRAHDDDWPGIWAIVSEVLAGGDTYTLSPDTSEAEARAYWTGNEVMTWVAETEGDIVGTYAVRANHRGLGAHVANAGYMVKPSASGKGIGTAMGEHSLDVARAAGFRAMQFNAVVSTNTRAVALWQRLGFRIIGTVPEAFLHRSRGYVDLHIMHRFL
jgi:L-amino acid N-acyltransferase YncA